MLICMKYQDILFALPLLLIACNSDSSSNTTPDESSSEQEISSSSIGASSSENVSSNHLSSTPRSSASELSSSVKASAASNESSGTFTDLRDGHIYKWQRFTVSIGAPVRNPVYMAENLAYKPSSGNSWCYLDLEENCDKYGRLYSWETAMDGAPSSQKHPSGVQGICPEGWHLPSLQEWETLTENAKYKNTYMNLTGWNSEGTTVPTNKSGFSALPAGFRYAEESSDDNGNVIWFNGEGFAASFWSSTKLEIQFAIAWTIDNTSEDFGADKFARSTMNIDGGASIRCVQDQ